MINYNIYFLCLDHIKGESVNTGQHLPHHPVMDELLNVPGVLAQHGPHTPFNPKSNSSSVCSQPPESALQVEVDVPGAVFIPRYLVLSASWFCFSFLPPSSSFDRVSLCSNGWLRTHYINQAGINSQISACFCLPSARDWHVHLPHLFIPAYILVNKCLIKIS